MIYIVVIHLLVPKIDPLHVLSFSKSTSSHCCGFAIVFVLLFVLHDCCRSCIVFAVVLVLHYFCDSVVLVAMFFALLFHFL